MLQSGLKISVLGRQFWIGVNEVLNSIRQCNTAMLAVLEPTYLILYRIRSGRCLSWHLVVKKEIERLVTEE